MASQLQGHESWMITGSWKTTMTVEEMNEYVKEHGGGGTGEGVTEEQMNTAIAQGVAPKADKSYVDAELSGKASASALNTKADKSYVDTEIAKKPSKAEVDSAIDTKVSQLGTTLGAELEEFDQRKANINEVVTGVNGSTGNVTVNKTTVGLGNVDNTADSAKPVSTAQKTALDKKVDKEGIGKFLGEAVPIPHVDGVVDFNTLDFGEHSIQTDNAINAPPNTNATVVWVNKTHSTTDSSFPFTDLPEDIWEQGTVSHGGSAGLTRDYIVTAGNPLAPSRIRTKTLIPIESLGNIKLSNQNYKIYCSFFGEDELTMALNYLLMA